MPCPPCPPVFAIVATTILAAGLAAIPCAAQASKEVEPAPTAAAIPQLSMERVWRDVEMKRPVQLVARPDRDDRAYIVEQAGRILEVGTEDMEKGTSRVWVDLREVVNDQNNEEGLLSLVFHPRVKENGECFVLYTASSPRREVVARLRLDESRENVLSTAPEVILEQEDPAWNHNGGTLLFGPDGMLYGTIGDGGSANDPWGNGQNLGVLLAKCFRIDVGRQEGGRPYAIPADNPFVKTPGARGEIWAFGLRNIWRMSFDRKTGDLWGGDVGQNAYEEIDLIVKGGNYGWRPREGHHATPGVPDASESAAGFIEPVVEYGRRAGVSVTGGYVYRGSEFPDLEGVYLYADYAYGTIWGFRSVGGAITAGPVVVARNQGFVASFGELNDGSLYACSTRGGPDGPGRIFRIETKGNSGPTERTPGE